MRVGVAGDWHGNTGVALAAVRTFAEQGVDLVLHLGDFGLLWPGNSGQKYHRKVERVCAEHSVRLLVTPGNHEHWTRTDRLPLEARDGFGEIGWVTDHVAVLPRAHRFKIGDRSFVSLGGAVSVDREWRTADIDWWAQEAIEPEHVHATVAGGPVDVFLAHDSPAAPYWTPAVAQICTTNPQDWPADAVVDAAVGRTLMRQAFEAIAPSLFLHGHYHVRDSADVVLRSGGGCRIESLAADGEPGNVAILDLDTLRVEDLQVR
ncbi:metallophosphoesterase [Nocardioides sp. GY 10113]|uniref:metallophosphoesterase family protein n=1 Tax=Nocardioides sp. GY 10113 TaxID=2569761 RepID=UPI001458B2AB|nr:metallophosphoesterase [Nocardioides sp. GY 10113]